VGTTQLPVQRVPVVVALVKRPEREAEDAPPSFVQVTNRRNSNFIPMNEMGGTCSKFGGEESYIQGFSEET
jgi:hypothetical protein